MGERMRLVGAMPLGNGRWRAQGYLHDGNVGGVKYLGTFATEEEASAVFLHEKERLEVERYKAAEAEADRILSGPTYVYQCGVGRGASLNGTRFKIIQTKDAHSALAAPLLEDGSLAFDAQRVVLMAYLHEEVEPQRVDRTAGLTVETDQEILKKEVLKFVSRACGQSDNISLVLDFLQAYGEPKLRNTLAHIRGDRTFSQQIAWLRANTHIPPNLLRQIESEALNGLFMGDDAQAMGSVNRKFGLQSGGEAIDFGGFDEDSDNDLA